MPDVKAIRAGLEKSAEARALADEMNAAATKELKDWLQKAQEHPDMTMAEAARLARVSRESAYKMLRE